MGEAHIGYNILLIQNIFSNSIDGLKALLKKNIDDNEKAATIHYEIYKINNSVEHRQKALELYQKLYSKTPKYDYKKRLKSIYKTIRK